MIVAFLSVLDVIAAIVVAAGYFWSFPVVLVIYVAAYLIVKGGIFYSSLTSWIDIAIGVWLLITLLGASHIMSLVAGVWLLSKGLSGLVLA